MELYKRLAPVVQAWDERDLSELEYSLLLVEALVIKPRKGGGGVMKGN